MWCSPFNFISFHFFDNFFHTLRLFSVFFSFAFKLLFHGNFSGLNCWCVFSFSLIWITLTMSKQPLQHRTLNKNIFLLFFASFSVCVYFLCFMSWFVELLLLFHSDIKSLVGWQLIYIFVLFITNCLVAFSLLHPTVFHYA